MERRRVLLEMRTMKQIDAISAFGGTRSTRKPKISSALERASELFIQECRACTDPERPRTELRINVFLSIPNLGNTGIRQRGREGESRGEFGKGFNKNYFLGKF